MPAGAHPAEESALLIKGGDCVNRRAAFRRLVPVLSLQSVTTIFQSIEQSGDRRVLDGLVAVVVHQILLADVSDIARLHILCQQVVKRLILPRSKAFRDRIIPFVGVAKDRINVEHYAAEIEHAMANDVTDREPRMRDGRGDRMIRGGVGKRGHGVVHTYIDSGRAPTHNAGFTGLLIGT